MKKEVEQKIHEFAVNAEVLYKAGYEEGYKAGHEGRCLLTDKECLADQKRQYERGLNDAWECIRQLEDMPSQVVMDIFHFSSIYKIARNYTATEITDKIKEYKEEQKQIEEWDSETMCGQFYENDKGIKAQTQIDDRMTKEEKIYLIKCLLEDIRGNWATTTIPRVTKAKELCEELGGEFLKLADTCNEYISDNHLDGRFFRDEFPFGYENMEKLYNLPHTLYDKSEEFQSIANELITYPEFTFDDVENRWW